MRDSDRATTAAASVVHGCGGGRHTLRGHGFAWNSGKSK